MTVSPSVTLRRRVEKFWAKVEKPDPTACWLWKGRVTRQGYGYTNHGYETRYAHRLSYELLIGPIPEGLTLDHLCRNRACVNPDHLEPVTNVENVMRGMSWAGVNSRKTHCPQGHEYTPENTYHPPNKKGATWRACRECHNVRTRARYRRQKENA